MTSSIVISSLQHAPTPCDMSASLSRLESACADAAEVGSRILLLPESSMTGYNISISDRDNHAEECDGALRNEVATLARRYALAINYGYIEKDGDQYFNSVQLIDRTGTSIAHYRKTHLWGDLDKTLFTAGDRFAPLTEIDGWRIGQLICYDVEFPEAVRQLALAGADLILISTALMEPWTTVADLIVPARAAENQIYIAYGNYCGSENGIPYVGHSCIADPAGSVLAKAGSTPELLHATLEREPLNSIRQALPYFRDRRPELYTEPD
ncbi:MAG: carbon-nitrogen hydrolase family protein [Gammaproteobacteria bacterium]|nr:carbon-nitrogen hydrolase family protein [Gammaproteobacteria bacterium]